jgi:hypothetical protein
MSDFFTCPHCGTLAQQDSGARFAQKVRGGGGSNFPTYHGHERQCAVCKKYTLFFDREVVYPRQGLAPPAADDMPEPVAVIYQEAAAVSAVSPRSAAALLRLAIEVLVTEEMGVRGNLNEAIGQLVRAERITRRMQQALDVVRVTGNAAVHTRVITDKDDRATVTALFDVLNLIVQIGITDDQRLSEMYEQLPDGALEAIERRDTGNE